MSEQFTRFHYSDVDAENSASMIEKESKDYLKFGVRYLDDALIGISKSDVILIGGRSGGGKTELATQIGMTNALKGKKVYFFALEAEKGEISFRIKYKILANCYFAEKRYEKKYIAYDHWMAGLLGDAFKPYEAIANDEMRKFSNLRVRYGSENYTLDDYEKDLEEIKNDADLVIIDHLHYFDIDESQANAELKMIVKRIKALAMDYRIPVVLVSHIRKMDRRHAGLLPDQEDFHGSSDIIKIATKAITISSAHGRKCYQQGQDEDDMSEIKLTGGSLSFIRAVKNRRNGSVSGPIGLVVFNHETNSYSRDYYLGQERTEDRELCFVAFSKNEKFPLWATGAVNE